SSTPYEGPAAIPAESAVDAQILRSLRDRWRIDDAVDGLAGEIVRLGTVAAGLHRAEVGARLRGSPTGTPIAESSIDPVDGCDGASPSEDAA
ncbi:MAG: hypothetical protein VX672_10450, partial [Planctomycetota bacterium]|nr:hypothetical protein [Planctomycetota bacterium]